MRPWALLVVLWSVPAWAQVCCIGGGAIEPARLAMHEQGLAALQIHGGLGVGSLSAAGSWIRPPDGARELELTQELIGAVRLLRRAQLSLAVPIVETWRRAGALDEVGGGVGDLSVGGRWDFNYPGHSEWIPGLGVTAGVVAPTGRALENAQLPLGSDATGAGTLQVLAGLDLEQVYGNWVINGRVVGAWSPPRKVYGLTVQSGPQVTVSLAGGYALDARTQLALALSTTHAADNTVDGQIAKGSARSLSTVSLSGAREVGSGWRLNGALMCDLPWLGRNRALAAGASVMVVRTFDFSPRR